jgi:NitT/TauT family transport system ATP-binding protein
MRAILKSQIKNNNNDGGRKQLMARGATLSSKPALPGAGEVKAASPNARRRVLTDQGRPLLDVRSVTIQYKTQRHLVTATYRVGFNVLQGDRFVVLGPSGCGKSTLLKAVCGYLQPTEGEIRLKGELITKPGPDRIMVFQEFDQLLPWKTVLENVAFPLKVTGTLHGRAAEERAMEYINMVKLASFAHSYPHTLSGGMKQRAAIARGMAMEPDILLMDEPFAALDALTRTRMQDELLALWDDIGFTVLFVTHSIPEAIKIGSRILLLSPQPGQVKAEINSVPRGQENSDEAAALGRGIHEMLFSDQIKEMPNATGG